MFTVVPSKSSRGLVLVSVAEQSGEDVGAPSENSSITALLVRKMCKRMNAELASRWKFVSENRGEIKDP